MPEALLKVELGHRAPDLLFVHPCPGVEAAVATAVTQNCTKLALRGFDDGHACLDYLASDRFELYGTQLPVLLLGFRLRGMQGIDVLRRVRGDRRRCGVPVVMLGAPEDRALVWDAYQAGANACVLLPDEETSRLSALAETVDFWTRIAITPTVRRTGR